MTQTSNRWTDSLNSRSNPSVSVQRATHEDDVAEGGDVGELGVQELCDDAMRHVGVGRREGGRGGETEGRRQLGHEGWTTLLRHHRRRPPAAAQTPARLCALADQALETGSRDVMILHTPAGIPVPSRREPTQNYKMMFHNSSKTKTVLLAYQSDLGVDRV